MSAPPKHRGAIVRAAATLFRRNGYAATGINEIAEVAGAPKGSLYHYFPDGKDGIGEAAVRFAGKGLVVTLEKLEAEHKSTAQMIQAGLHPTAEQVAANMRAIENNQQNIATSKEQIAAQKKRLAAQQGQLAAQQGQLTTQQGQLAAQKQSVEANQKNVAANQQQIAANIKDIEENTNRFIALSEYDVKGAGTVKFNVGSSTISAKDQEELKKLAQTAIGLKGYIIEVMGYADSTGSAAMNTKLSEERARAVVTFLMQQGGVPVRHIVAPGAMGEYGPVAPNETKAGRAENRRVDVKVLVNKGIAGA